MTVIFVNRFFFPDHSATSQMLSDLAFGLAKQGMKICIVTSRQRYDNPKAQLATEEDIEGVKIKRVATPSFGRGSILGRMFDYLGFYVSATWALMMLADKNVLVVAKTDPPLMSIPAALVCKVRQAHLINWLQDLFPEVAIALGVPATGGMLGKLLKRWRNWSLRQACKNVVIGERMRERLLEEGIPSAKIALIQNWADGSIIKPIPPEKNPLREKWGLEGKFVVGYSGNLGRAHDAAAILSTAKILHSNEEIVFLFIGDGHHLASLRQLSEQLPLRNVLFKPYQPSDSLAFSLSAIDMHFVSLLSELEGLIVPSKIYGILAAGRPFIMLGAEDGELGRLAQKTSFGKVFEGTQADVIAEYILKQSRQRNAPLQKKVRRYFEVNHDRSVALNQWRELVMSSES